MWTYQYDNDTGPQDDYFVEFYNLLKDGEEVGRIYTESDAKAICAAMNAI